MKTRQMTRDDDLVELHLLLEFRQDITCLEQKHQKGYEEIPVQKGEFSVWESEQEWGD